MDPKTVESTSPKTAFFNIKTVMRCFWLDFPFKKKQRKERRVVCSVAVVHLDSCTRFLQTPGFKDLKELLFILTSFVFFWLVFQIWNSSKLQPERKRLCCCCHHHHRRTTPREKKKTSCWINQRGRGGCASASQACHGTFGERFTDGYEGRAAML